MACKAAHLLLCTAIEPIQEETFTFPTMQDHLMRCFMQDVDEAFAQKISENFLCVSPCGMRNHDEWFGVHCVSDHVRTVRYNGEHCGNFALEYLPPSVDTLLIEGCLQRYQLNFRRMPRSLIELSLELNQINGSVDLRALPRGIEHLNLARNAITGPIKLTALPPRLKMLKLQYNVIQQRTVYVANIPKSVQAVILMGSDDSEERNTIRKVRPLTPQDRAALIAFQHELRN